MIRGLSTVTTLPFDNRVISYHFLDSAEVASRTARLNLPFRGAAFQTEVLGPRPPPRFDPSCSELTGICVLWSSWEELLYIDNVLTLLASFLEF